VGCETALDLEVIEVQIDGFVEPQPARHSVIGR
jgi:hypothetical protein